MGVEKVFLQKTDTCLTYALKRLGIFCQYGNLDAKQFEKRSTKHQIKNLENLQYPSLIMVKHPPESFVCYNEIDELGRVYLNEVSTRWHFMVYEGDFLSDATRDDNGYMYIRVRKLSEFNLEKHPSKWFVLTES